MVLAVIAVLVANGWSVADVKTVLAVLVAAIAVHLLSNRADGRP
ncbi:hypothetical protein ACIBF1_44120 [Spirillospora sp. NPDC050679]